MDRNNASGVTRVAILGSAFHPHTGGVEELVRQLAHALGDRGVAPIIFTMRWPTSLPAAELVEGLPVRRFVFRSPSGSATDVCQAAAATPITLARFVRALRDERCQVLHVQCVSESAWYARQAARLLRLPLVVTLQGELMMDATGLYQRSRAARHTMRQVLGHADAVTACSRATLTEAEDWRGATFGSRARVIHNGVHVADFMAAVPRVEDRPYILVVGRHVRQKGFDVMLEAMAILTREPMFRHRLLVAGDGTETVALQTLARDLHVDDRVCFVGSQDRSQIASLFRGADLFVLPSRHEPFGIVILEAMAAGVPVIATAVGGVPEFVIDGETGVLVHPDDPVDLARAIKRVVADPVSSRRRAQNAAQVAAANDWSILVDQYLDVYRSVVSARPTASPA